MTENFLLVTVVVMFTLSLVAAFILFKVLKSSALIEKAGYRAGGALAGFLLVYAALYSSFQRLVQAEQPWKPISWTVIGTVQKELTSTHEGVIIRHVPPRPFTTTDASGSFRLENVLLRSTEGLPEINIETSGYYPKTYRIDVNGAEIEPATKIIKLKQEIDLKRIPENPILRYKP